MSRLSRQFVLCVGLICWGHPGVAQEATTLPDFHLGPGNGVYRYASSTPDSVADLVESSRPRPTATAQGQLLMPPPMATGAALPAVVLVHGSGGVYREELTYWARLLNEQGMAALVIDVFSPRGVNSTGKDQSLVPFAADTADAFAALRMLASHPGIDPRRIAVVGFSRGGITAVRSAVEPIIQGSAPAGLRFAAHVALYSGGCANTLSVMAAPGVFSKAPMLFVHGDADDYADMSDCQAYAGRISGAGTPAAFVVLPGARHKFDLDRQRVINRPLNSKTKAGCPLEYDILAMTPRDRRSGEALSKAQVKSITRDLCTARGATMGGNTGARDAAGKAVVEFLLRSWRAV